jgi:membrane dipeptidase
VSSEDYERLHRESLVVDTMGPPGPSLHSEKMLARLDELVAEGAQPARTIDEMERMADEAVINGELDGFWEGWERSGVDVSSVTLGAFGPLPFTYENAMRDITRWQRKFDALDRFVHVRSAADAERAHEAIKHGIILNFQNTEHFGDDLGRLEDFYELGIRIIQLTYNGHNLVGDGCTQADPSGLSLFGVEVVKRMNELGILIDVSHCSEPTSLDAVKASEKPVAITHGFSRTLNPHDRGASDDLLRAVANNGGYVGIVLVPFFLTTESRVTLDHFLKHVDYVAGLIGVDHVGIGTDWAPPVPPQLQTLLTEEVRRIGFRSEHRVDWGATIDELPDWTDWPNITRALVAQGYSDNEVRGIVGGNFLRTLRDVVG